MLYYKDGIEDEVARVEPSMSSQWLALSWIFLFSVVGLLPELLFESEPKVAFCNTPVGEDPI